MASYHPYGPPWALIGQSIREFAQKAQKSTYARVSGALDRVMYVALSLRKFDWRLSAQPFGVELRVAA